MRPAVDSSATRDERDAPRLSALTLPRARTIAEDAANALREQIRTGQLEPGMPLRQGEIAERMGVSITPVREAFGLLEREGLVQRTTHRGVVVFRPSIEDLLNGYEIRSALEALAASKAAEKFEKPDVSALRQILDDMAEVHDDTAYVELNARFHAHIEGAARNPRLSGLIKNERTATNAYILFLGVQTASSAETHTEHEAIIEALASNDSERAAQVMSMHLRNRARELEERFKASPRRREQR